MRTLGVILAAAVLGALSAWGATRYEFRYADNPLSGMLANTATLAGEAHVQVVGSETFDFGSMNVGKTQSHTFVLKNVGEAPLVLTKGNTTCKCTLSDVEEGTVAPGATKEVKLEWTPPAASEEFEQSAEIKTNDRSRNTVRLVVRGRVLDAFKLEPPNFTLGSISNLEGSTHEAILWNYQSTELQITNCQLVDEALAPFFQVQTQPVTAEVLQQQPDAKSGVMIKIELKQGIPLGAFSQKILLQHNQTDLPPVELVLSGKAVGDITVMGANYNKEHDYIELGSVERSQGAKAKVFLVVKGPQRDEIKIQVESVDPAKSLRAELGTPTNPGGKSILWPLTIEVPPGAEPTSRLGSDLGKLAKIMLSTNEPSNPNIVVKVRVSVVAE
jgi:hypothetical protein